MLKTLCVLLQVLMLTRAANEIAILSEELEDSVSSEKDIISTINYHFIFKSVAKFQFVQNFPEYTDSVIVKNKAEGSPSEPRFPRAFMEVDNRLNEGDNIIIKFRWKKPKFINGVIQGYTARYWLFKNQIKSVYTIHNISATTLQIIVSKVTPDNIYYFQIQAHNEVGAGPYTKFINVSTTDENPVPLLLINSWHSMKVLDMDLQTVFILNEYKAKEIIYSALEHKIYWINEMSELFLSDFKPNIMEEMRNYIKITELDNSAHNLCIDWIARNLYWIENSNQTRNIMKLDLTLWQQFGIAKYDSIVKINEFKFFNILPFKGYFHWIEINSNNQYVIMQSDLDGKNMKPFSINEDRCICPYKLLEASSMKIDNTIIDKPLMYWTSKDGLIVANISGCDCKLILRAGNQTFFNYLTIDKTNIYLFSSSKKQIYILEKKYALLESKEIAFASVKKFPFFLPYIYQVIALDRSLQSYPQKMCLIPKRKDYQVKVLKLNITANSIVISLPEPIPNSGCKKYNLATTIYDISVSHCLNNDFNEFKEFNVQTYELQQKIQNLTPFTKYTLKLALSNFYVDKLWINLQIMDGLQFGTDVIGKTIPGKLNAPENVTVQILTPTLAKIYWMPPKKLNCVAVNYEVHWMSVPVSNGTQEITYQMQHNKQFITKLERTVDGKFFTIIQPLLPGKEYLIYVRVYPANSNFSEFFTDSLNKSIYMYPEPNNLTLSGANETSMNISWIPSVNLTIHYILQYKSDAMQEWQKVYNTKKNNDKVTYYIENLLPRTPYKFRLILRYPEYMKDFIWPDEGFIFNTLGTSSFLRSGLLILCLVVTLVIYVCYFYCSCRQRRATNEQVPPSTTIDVAMDIDEAMSVSGAEVSRREMETIRRERELLEQKLAVAQREIEFLREREIWSDPVEDGDRERDGPSGSATSGGSGGDD